MKNSGSKIGKILINNNTYIMLLLLLIICAVISPDFFTLQNITNLLRQYSGTTIVCMGMLFVILTGGIDLSVGSIVALGSVMVAYALTTKGLGMFGAIALPLLCGLACGLLTGFFVAITNMASFVASLAMMTIARGVAYVISNGQPVQTPQNTIGRLGVANFAGAVPWLAIIALLFVVLFWIVLKYTSFGRIVIAIGSNEMAVRLAGIRTRWYKLAVYAISGVCSGMAGIIASSRTAIGTPIIGQGLELDAIAACVIGGASLSGGRGSVLKTVVGVFVLAFISNIMNLLAVPAYPQDIIKGAIIIASVLLQEFTANKSETI
ncbi:monosaccharide-transporting ATPase [Lachnospiraceae bacterium]|uniref:ABC transporter permease n=1 Tax=Extibacter sp. GGCC_0201 TaxID=2731209 RepID=UPI001AA16804|nr:ABC transporter permease [Extibacter sp. GGCC_0201]MBO1720494.1 ABC transporter permease [Extibacter sp. GGCC_0201]BDF34655.1 monosaccharide-transporting ATPase [Lachnospiraceae bacterium]BDF38657.1 monosaccharide-transporting ATPase [Lachnospiraceae bacterium]